jgi:hypothetical protein
MKLTEAKIIEQRVAYNQLVESICKGMDTSQRKTILEAKASVRNINRVLREAQLSTAQINALFGAVEQNATASGSNRTIVGKGKDVVDAVNNIINQTGRWIQNTTPVQGFDAKFEQLKGAVGAKFPELDKQLTGLGDWAKENPGKTAAIIGVLTVLGGIAGGPVGGAIAGQALRGSMELIKGEKLSTAIGKGAKTAAIGALTGFALEKVKEVITDLLPAEVRTLFFNPNQGTIDVSKLKGMGIVDPANLDADSAVELIQARSGLAELVRVPDMPPEAKEELMKQLQEVNTKLVELGGGANVKDAIDNLQDQFDITGSGIEVQTTTATDAASGSTASIEVTGEIDANTLNDIGINAADYSPNKWISDNKDALLKYMDQEQLDAWQNASALSRAIDQREFEGVAIASNQAFRTVDNIDVAGIPDTLEIGEVYKSTINTEIGGVPWSASANVSVEGVDAAGNAVYKFTDVFTEPDAIKAGMWDALDGMPQELQDELLAQFSGVAKGGAEVVADTAAQDIANGIMQGIVATGVGAAMADKEIKDAGTKQESRRPGKGLTESDIFKLFTAVAYKQPLVESQYVDEAPIGDMIKKAGSAVAGAAKSAAGAVAQKAATVGKNITTKVTVDKLMKAWEKAGSPNNDAKIAQFLAGFGIEPRAVQAAFKTAKLAVPKDAPMDQVEVIVSQAKQNSKLKDAIIAYLEGPTKRTPDTGLGQQPQTATA